MSRAREIRAGQGGQETARPEQRLRANRSQILHGHPPTSSMCRVPLAEAVHCLLPLTHSRSSTMSSIPKHRPMKGKNKRTRGPRTCRQKCSDCGRIETVSRWDLLRAVRLRCPACGGPLNRLREALAITSV
jgi:hypothetical protein